MVAEVDAAGRARRERLRGRAAEMFAQGVGPVEVAAALEVSTKSAYQWRRAWVAGGVRALASQGPSGPDPKLSDEQLERLRARLEQARRRPGTARTSGGPWRGWPR
ncbi:helix-turn-helix domain-containing protein [Catellatospora coxensis]